MAAVPLVSLLEQLLVPDNAVIQQATKRLREALKEPGAVGSLAQIVGGEQRPQLRQLAAILLRRRLSASRWRRLDPEVKLRLPSLLVEALEKENDRSVLPALSHLVAVVLRRGAADQWGPMGLWVQRAATDPQLQERALQVLSFALDPPAPLWLPPHSRPIADLCLMGLRPGTPPHIMGAALKALGGLAAALGGTQTVLLRSLLPEIIRSLRVLIDADEALGADALEVLDEFMAADPKAVTSDLRPLLDLCLEVGGAVGRSQSVRRRAVAVLGFVAQERPRALQPFLPPLLSSLLTLMCRPPPMDPPDPEDEEQWGGGEGGSVRHCAAQVLNSLALGIPAEKLLRELVPRLEALLVGADPWGRKGALTAMGAVAEGCGGGLRKRYMGPVLGSLRGGLRDPEGMVRGAAASALRSISESMKAEASALALEALPGALASLPVEPEALPGSPEVLPGARDWFVLREIMAAAGPAAAPHMESIMGAMLGVLRGGRPQQMELALSVMHDMGLALEDCSLCPQGGAVESALLEVARLSTPQHRWLKLQALEVMGSLGGSVAALGPALEMAANGDGDERRVLFGLCGAAAEALKEGAEPMLPKLLPLLINSLQAPPTAAPDLASDSFLLFDPNDDEDDQPMGDEEDDVVPVEVNGDHVTELEAACQGAGLMAEHCGAAFQPYFGPTLEALLPLLEFPHPDVRAAAYGALGGLSRGAARAVGQEEIRGRSLLALMEALRKEKGAEPTRAGLIELNGALSPAPNPRILHAIGCLMADVINGKIRCFQDEDNDDDEEVEAMAELRELAGEGLAAVGGASQGGGAWSEAFQDVLPTLIGCLSGDAAQRSWAAAMLGEVGQHLPGGVASKLLPLIGPALARSSAHDPDPEVRSNALYSIGRLAANGVALGAAWPGLAVIGRALKEEGPNRARDNACASLVRHRAAMTDEELLSLLLPALPLVEDFEENSTVFGYLTKLPISQLLPHAELMPRVCSAIGTHSMDCDLEAAVVGLLRELWMSCPIDVGRGMERLPHSDRDRLRKAMGLDAAAATPLTVSQ